jgi:hypothetical protein
MSFVHKTALVMTVRSSCLMIALQMFRGICFTHFLESSLSQWHVFYITVLKIIYVYSNGMHNTYETYMRMESSPNEIHRVLLKEPNLKKEKRMRGQLGSYSSIFSTASFSTSSTVGIPVTFAALSDKLIKSFLSRRSSFHFLAPAINCFNPTPTLSVK